MANRHNMPLELVEIAAPVTPPAGVLKVYAATDDHVHTINDVGEVKTLAPMTSVVLGADFTNNTVTLNPVTGWTYAMRSGKSYKVEVLGNFQTVANTTGIGFGLQGTGTFRGFFSIAATNSIAATENKVVISSSASSILSTAVAAANTPHHFQHEFIVTATANSNLVITMRSEIAASEARILAGSALIITELG